MNVTLSLSSRSQRAGDGVIRYGQWIRRRRQRLPGGSGTVTFDAGETTETIALVVNGDRVGEPNETFLVNLSQAQGGVVSAMDKVSSRSPTTSRESPSTMFRGTKAMAAQRSSSLRSVCRRPPIPLSR